MVVPTVIRVNLATSREKEGYSKGLYQLPLNSPYGGLRAYMSIYLNTYKRIRVYT